MYALSLKFAVFTQHVKEAQWVLPKGIGVNCKMRQRENTKRKFSVCVALWKGKVRLNNEKVVEMWRTQVISYVGGGQQQKV